MTEKQWDNSEALIALLRRASKGLEKGWLYLPDIEQWCATTPAIIVDVDALDVHEVDEDDEPLFAKTHNLILTLESATVESIVSFASNLDVESTDELLLESFNYYFDNDAFLPYAGFTPLAHEESQKKLDRDFYDSLGEERLDKACKKEGCERGAISGSAFCKVHHFEMIRQRTCPFSD